MAISERLAYVLTFDTSSGVKSLEKMGATADKELGKVDSKVDKLGVGMQKFGAGAVAAAGIAGAGLFKLAGSASDLAESVNAVNVTFEDSADGIKKLGEEAARSVGLSKTEFNGLAVQFSSFAKTVAGEGGDVVSTMDDLTTRAADFASVMNLDVAEAARVFQSGLAGETEPLKKFGIDLSAAAVGAYAVANGISDSAASMTEAEKVQARYGLLMQQTTQMQGDFANTSDGAANQQRILKAELSNLAADIGTGVLPMFTTLVSTLTKVTGAFSSLSPGAKSAIGTFATLGVAALGLAGSASFVIGKLITMRANLALLGKFAGPMAAGIGVGSVAIAGFALHAQKAAADAAMLAENVRDISRASDEALLDTFNRAMLEAVANGEGVNKTLTMLAETQLGAAKRVVDLAKAKGEENAITRELEAAIQAELDARKNAEVSQAAETKAVEANTDAAGENAEVTEESTRQTDAWARALENAATQWDYLTGQLDTNDAIRNTAQQFDDLAEAAVLSWEATTENADDAVEKQRGYQQAVDDTKRQVIDLITQLGNVPTQVTTQVLALIDEGKFAEAERRLQMISTARTVYIDAITRGGGFQSSQSGVRSHAGSIVGGQSFNGLRDDEVPMILQRGEAVLTKGQQESVVDAMAGRSGGSSGGNTYNITITGLTGPQVADELVNKIKEYERRNGGLPW